jgi:hypothetical protein
MLRRFAFLAVVASLSLAALAPTALAAGPRYTPGAPGMGDPYYPLDGNGGYDVQHYDLDVSYDPDTDRLVGEATIEIRATQGLSAFNMDFVGLTIRSIKIDGRSATWTRDAGELTIRPRSGLDRGTRFTLVVRYDGVPQTLEEFGLSGFIHTDDGAVIVGQPHVAATWFPANDHPSDKASFTFRVAVPAGLEVIANGLLVGQRTRNGWKTWTWDAKAPMATYLAGVGIGQFDMRSYQRSGIKYWDGIDSSLMADLAPPMTPVAGTALTYSQTGNGSYKRLTRVIAVPAAGATLSFQVNRDTEGSWDFLFVEARTAGGSDWTTLPDANGHTDQDTGACTLGDHPFLAHYMQDVPPDDNGTPDDPEDDIFFPCAPTGTTGEWHAISGASDGWESWSIALPGNGVAHPVEVSIAYASDSSVQFRGVALDALSVTAGTTTSFEPDPLAAGWVAPPIGPDGQDNADTWISATSVAAAPGLGASALVSFDRQPEILKFEAERFGPYPFDTSGGIVDVAEIGFALENQTRPIYSQSFFGGPDGNDFVVVHELAHQWFGDSLALDRWQHIWLNEGFATYAEWLWGEREGFETAQEVFDSFMEIPADDDFWQLAIGDPGPDQLFDFPVYGRGALTLHALRLQVGDRDFFRILKEWTRSKAGGTVTTREFIRLAERISHDDLDDLFAVWLASGKPDTGAGLRRMSASQQSFKDLPLALQSLVARLADSPGQPFPSAPKR